MFRKIVGFDIGESSVKLVYAVNGKVQKTAEAELPGNMVKDGVIQSMDSMADFLKKTARENRIPGCAAAVVLPDSLVFSRQLSLPAMTESQLVYNLPFEFKDYFTQDKENYFFDYAVSEIRKNERGEPEEMELYACAVLKSTIADYRKMFSRAGFSMKAAVPTDFALIPLVRRCMSEKLQDAVFAVVDFGHHSTKMQMIADGRPNARRNIEMGMEDIDRLVADMLSTSVEEAHRKKLSGDILESDYCQSLYQSLSVEILKAINFYNYNNRDRMIQKICCCGGGSEIRELTENIAVITESSVCSFAQECGLEESMNLYLRAYGCALTE